MPCWRPCRSCPPAIRGSTRMCAGEIEEPDGEHHPALIGAPRRPRKSGIMRLRGEIRERQHVDRDAGEGLPGDAASSASELRAEIERLQRGTAARRMAHRRAGSARRRRSAARHPQPPRLRARAQALARLCGALRHAGGADVHRPRRLQGGQRPLRPCRRRRAAQAWWRRSSPAMCARPTWWAGSAATSSAW